MSTSADALKVRSNSVVRRVRVLKHQEKRRRWNMTKMAGASIAILALLMPLTNYVDAVNPVTVPPGTIDPLTIPKFVNQLTGSPPVYKPVNVTDSEGNLIRQQYTVYMEDDIDGQPILQQILPAGFPKTRIWGYAGAVYSAANPDGVYSVSAPGASFEATKGVPSYVTWVNNIDNPNMFPVDPTLHWANPTGIPMEEVMEHSMMGMSPTYPPGYDGTVDEMTNPEGWDAQSIVPAVAHLHGAEVSSWYDGGPDAWFTNSGIMGPTYSLSGAPSDLVTGTNSVLYKYTNEQPVTTLWYHDHALGITRTNVMSGLAGFYFLRDSTDPISSYLPSGKYEVPLAIQDRTFNLDGSFWFDTVGINPEHPYWTPEFFGNTVMVNGLVWPNMQVDQGLYRLRLLDGSNARFYTLSFSNGMPFTVIGSDGGYLRAPATVTKLTIAPGERYDVLVDFRGLPAGTKVIMLNSAKAPFPNGAPATGNTVGQIMQFEVTGTLAPVLSPLPAILNADLAAGFPSLSAAAVTNRRILTLTEVMGPGGPLEILLDGQKWANNVSELPVYGTTEEWVIVNPTADTHPIHLHLVQFQLVSRQRFDVNGYIAEWSMLNMGISTNTMDPMMPPYSEEPQDVADLAKYLKSNPKPAANWEQGWKDTVQMNPGEVTIIRMKFAPIDGSPLYSFDPTEGPGYVWHCHIIDHEDNEMMRPYQVVAAVPVE
jgi:FtsP/CotA-like multicopper oxidase with cupredoxin domain